MSVELWNLSGVMVHSENLSAGNSISMSNVPAAGVYFLITTSERSKSISRIIVR